MTGREETHSVQVELTCSDDHRLARIACCACDVREAVHALLGAVREPQELPIHLGSATLFQAGIL